MQVTHDYRPLPKSPWVMAQTWHDLLFMHWRVSPESLRPLIPSNLTLETFDESAWIGVVPFYMTGVRLRGMPGFSFGELNVRTYVRLNEKPGVWFFSLDAANPLVVTLARLWYRLPYFHAKMCISADNEVIEYLSCRTHAGTPAAELRMTYRPLSESFLAKKGTLTHWLTERYCLYAADNKGGIYRTEIHHPPWVLRNAESQITLNTMTRFLGIELHGEPLLHFSKKQEVMVWNLKKTG